MGLGGGSPSQLGWYTNQGASKYQGSGVEGALVPGLRGKREAGSRIERK